MTNSRPVRSGSDSVGATDGLVTRAAGSGEARVVAAQPGGPSTLEEADARFVAARDAWIEAMRLAATGKPSDLASLAIAQEAYELASAELERWRSGERVAIPIDPERHPLDAVVNQELAWRHTHEAKSTTRTGWLGRIARRLGGR